MRPSWILTLAIGALLLAAGVRAASDGSALSADEALKQLMAGNKRYADGKATRRHQDAARRSEVAKGQEPMATILSCSDSRVPPEIVFDQGLGDLFVVRVAGNIAEAHGAGSIEYAVEHLGSPLIVVLGHERCGAVEATLNGGDAHGHIQWLVDAIRPAVDKAKGKQGDALDNAVTSNVTMVVERLKTLMKPSLAEMAKRVKIVGAHYDLDTGVVELLP
jgi:carbonic anhydrase